MTSVGPWAPEEWRKIGEECEALTRAHADCKWAEPYPQQPRHTFRLRCTIPKGPPLCMAEIIEWCGCKYEPKKTEVEHACWVLQ